MSPSPSIPELTSALAELTVRFGANLQPGQIMAIGSEPGKEELTRAIADAAYANGARFVDLFVFDYHLKRSRALHADPDTLDFVPPWYGQRMRALGELRCALVSMTGPVEPHLLDDVPPERIGKDILPRIRESVEVVNNRTANWTVVPSPTRGWAQLVYPDLDPEAALHKLWEDVAYVTRLGAANPVTAWTERMDRLEAIAGKLDAMDIDRLVFQGPGTDLSVGVFPSSRWLCARLSTVDGIIHAPNLPTEEVFTTPDPERVDGTVTSTKPLFVSGSMINGLRVRFEGGRAVQIDADAGGEVLRTMSEHDEGAARLGEVALVDRESRIGRLGTVFFDTLLDENAASHIALGQALDFAIDDPADRERTNSSELHTDFMIGSDDVAVTGVLRDGTEVPLLRGGAWQL
jgi:aminopeptidase